MKKNRHTFLLVFAIIYLICFFVTFRFIVLLVAAIFFVLYLKIEKKPRENKKDIPSNINVSNASSSQFKEDNVPKITSPQYKIENHHVAGTSFRQKDIASLAYENYEYDMSKNELIDEFDENEKIYKYDFNPNKIELIEEPDNPHDPNAIKVVIDDVLVGYIKKNSCSRVRNLLHSNSIIKIDAEISGGPYKIIYCDYDDDKEKDVYTVEKGKDDFFVTVSLKIANS